jgi:CheY-like chemotaxis protein
METQGLSGPQILVADDDPLSRELVVESLGSQGCTVLVAADGEQALAALERQHIDAVLLDLHMPVLDGYGVLDRLRDAPPQRRPALIVLSADPSREARERAIELGADGYLMKPLDLAELGVALAKAIRAAAARSAAEAPEIPDMN